MEEDNADDRCDEYLWSSPIDNADETKGLSKMTSWKKKGRYVAKPLNKVNSRYGKGSPSRMKDIPTKTSSE